MVVIVFAKEKYCKTTPAYALAFEALYIRHITGSSKLY